MNWFSPTEREMDDIAGEILKVCSSQKIFAIFGELGAGKTTLVKSFLRHLDSTSVVTSPTFSLINVYDSPKGEVYHFDLFRMRAPSELEEIGFYEYLDSGNFNFIEWPQIGMAFLGKDFISIEIQHEKKGGRKVSLSTQN